MKLVLLTTLVVCALLCTIGECYPAAPLLFRHLEYVPSLDYLRSVLRVSSESVRSAIVNPSLKLAYDVSKMANLMGYVLRNVTQASDVIATSLGEWSESNVRPLSDALHAVRHSLAEVDLIYPEYYRGQALVQELNHLKGLMEEQLDSLELKGHGMVRGELQLINSFLTVASSLVIANTLVLQEVYEIERTKVFLSQLFIPSELESTVLHDLLVIGARTNEYDQLYSNAFNSESERFLRFTTEGGQLLQTVVNGAPALPANLQRAVTEFNSQVDSFVQYATSELQEVRHVLQARAAKAFDDTIQSGYGVQASGMAMLRPYPRNLLCVRHMLPTIKTIVGSHLISIALCSNELTDFIYEQAIEYRDTVRQLEQQALAKLQMAAACTTAACDPVYSDALEFLVASTEKVRTFAPAIDTYQNLLLTCVNGKAQGAMSQLIEEIVGFNKCLAARKVSSDEDTLLD
ncbi:uncharacterized protein LOC118457374 isoform X2 [Anopheles albimanus]|uniref:uncharacterized protein LOC118457374 isoform X2 n=1 Tax=Anopheles albimanus TaxID=7167 RepID=UPI001641B373|nr:uncharacterized protein LOC118457374 isoform X2 [Anopheles albimanus]